MKDENKGKQRKNETKEEKGKTRKNEWEKSEKRGKKEGEKQR